ncbi:MAG: Vacuolar protein sorting-associated protein 8, partial [Stictis urceolatum]|nr:Vacuolar protein sorting-associated protein 8 [Stictis urceolata]
NSKPSSPLQSQPARLSSGASNKRPRNPYSFGNQSSNQSESMAFREIETANQDNETGEYVQGALGVVWDVIGWTKLSRISSEVFSEAGKRSYGHPTCIDASALIAIGTSKGLVLVFDYHQELIATIGFGTKAVESGSVTAVALSADHSAVAAGHSEGCVLTWDISKPAKPFLQLLPILEPQAHSTNRVGHIAGTSIVHVGFLGTRHTALVTADNRGMAFSHLASRGFGTLLRSISTTRILGRYTVQTSFSEPTKRPSSTLAFAPLPLGNVESACDSLGLVAILTPYLLVVVSTIPMAHTQHRASRPKELAPHGALSAALAWYPPMQSAGSVKEDGVGNAKLAYCWSNVVTFVEVVNIESLDNKAEDTLPEYEFQFRRKWHADEPIVAVQWLNNSVLALITITQRLLLFDYNSSQVKSSSDLLQKRIHHVDYFSSHLNQLVESLDEQNISMHGVVADAFYMSLRAYKGRLFLLGHNEVSIGTLSNWADRLLALMEHGDFVAAIGLATRYYCEESESASVGLPKDIFVRQTIVGERLLEMMSASLKYAFCKDSDDGTWRVDDDQLRRLVSACFYACLAMDDTDFIFEEIFPWYSDSSRQVIFFDCLEVHIVSGRIKNTPPVILKELVDDFAARHQLERLEEILCGLNPETVDLDQVTSLCQRFELFDALFYIWSQGIGDFTTVLDLLLGRCTASNSSTTSSTSLKLTDKILSYLTYILTGRVYPRGTPMSDENANTAKGSVYQYMFSSSDESDSHSKVESYHLKKLLDIDPFRFFEMLDLAFEDSYLNENTALDTRNHSNYGSNHKQQFSPSRQFILKTLLQVADECGCDSRTAVHVDMFVARALAKFPQFLLLPGNVMDGILRGLSRPSAEFVEDRQLSAEYLLSVYQPSDLTSLLPMFLEAKFFRISRAIYRSEKQFSLLLQASLQDTENHDAMFDCLLECLQPSLGLKDEEVTTIKNIITSNAPRLLRADLTRSAAILNQYAPDLHIVMIRQLNKHAQAQFKYLETFMMPKGQQVLTYLNPRSPLMQRFGSLLCEFDPLHVADYIIDLHASSIRMGEVLSTLTGHGIRDGSALLRAHNDQIETALKNLLRHLRTLHVTFLGLRGHMEVFPNVESVIGTADVLTSSLEKHTKLGIWLCQKQTHAGRGSDYKIAVCTGKSKVQSGDRLALHESLWLDLIDAVVEMAGTSDNFHSSNSESYTDFSPDGHSTVRGYRLRRLGEVAQLDNRLMAVVQGVFTSLLSVTSRPRSIQSNSTTPSFVRIFRAFLLRASAASPSLNQLRGVISTIFSAYTYEEEMLALAHKLLERDLYIRVEEYGLGHVVATDEGWRPDIARISLILSKVKGRVLESRGMKSIIVRRMCRNIQTIIAVNLDLDPWSCFRAGMYFIYTV